MSRKPEIAIVGPGRLGAALARSLRSAGYTISEVISRDLPESRRRAARLARALGAWARTPATASFNAQVVWLCVSDDAIRACAQALAPKTRWKGKVAFHSSGALSSDLLAACRRRGAAVASIHPMMTFGRDDSSTPSMAGVPFAIEGDARAVAVARRIARDLGGDLFPIPKQNKVLYHALGSFSSPLVVATLATAERVAAAAGIARPAAAKIMQPILQQTILNYLRDGAAAAFSGPIVRGDLATVRKHLAALKKVPEARQVYIALVRAALKSLPVGRRQEMRRVVSGE